MSTTVERLATTSSHPEVPPGKEVTAEELLKMPDGKHFELIDGELVEPTMSALSSVVAAQIIEPLGRHCRPSRLGWVLSSEAGYRCFPWKPRRVRRPHISFLAMDRYPLGKLSEEGHICIAPDLAIEVISPNDLASEVNEKIEDYVKAGVKLIWVVDPENRLLQVHRPDGSSVRLREADEVSGEDVIPGFRCRVDEFFPAAVEVGPTEATNPVP